MRPTARDRGDAQVEELFVRYRDTGDEAAFAIVYDLFGQRLFAIAVRFFRRRHGSGAARVLALDAVGDTWLRIVGCRDQWSGSPGTLAPWIMAIHYHCLLEAVRTSPPTGSATELDVEGRLVDPERCFLAREALERLSERLSPEEAELLMAYYLDGGPRLLAAGLGISDVALRKRVERVKDALRRDPRFGELIEVFDALRTRGKSGG